MADTKISALPSGTTIGGTEVVPGVQSSSTVKFTFNQALTFVKSGLSTVATSGAYSDLSGTPSLATVATSGSYTDLSNKPSIPTAANPSATAGSTVNDGSATTFMRSDASPAVAVGSSSTLGLVKVDGTTITATAGEISAILPTAANPTATAGSTVIDGSASTFMRSDAAPAIALGSSSTFGLVKVDGTTITASGGVITSVGGGGGPSAGNPTATIGTSAVNGSATTFMRSDAAPAFGDLTGPITSTGLATAVAAQTGTGSTFVMQASPSLTTPTIGVATATSINGVTIPSVTDTAALLGTAQTFSAANVFSAAGAASTPGLSATGVRFSGGSGTTTLPHVFYQENTATAGTAWSTSGTAFGLNMHGSTGNLIDFQVDGTSMMSLTGAGALGVHGNITSSNGSFVCNAGGFAAAASSTFSWMGGRGSISSPAANTVQPGGADAAAPAAQTVSFPSVTAGTSNTIGQPTTIQLSRSTGTALGGSLLFKGSPAGVTGTTQNAVVTWFSIVAGAPVLPSYTVATLPAAASVGAGGMAFVTDATLTAITGLGTTAIGGGSNKVPVYTDGTNWIIL